MYKLTHCAGQVFQPSIFVPTSWILFMPLLVCSFLKIKIKTTTKVKIKYKGLERAQPFLSLLPFLQIQKIPAEFPLGMEKTVKSTLSEVKSLAVHLQLETLVPPPGHLPPA